MTASDKNREAALKEFASDVIRLVNEFACVAEDDAEYIKRLTALTSQHFIEKEKFDKMAKVTGALIDEAVELRNQHDIILAENRQLKEAYEKLAEGIVSWIQYNERRTRNEKDKKGS